MVDDRAREGLLLTMLVVTKCGVGERLDGFGEQWTTRGSRLIREGNKRQADYLTLIINTNRYRTNR